MITKEIIIEFRKRGFKDSTIGQKFGISRQRVHQIRTGYRSPANYKIDPINHKILTKEKRILLGIPDINFNYELGGRDWVRELIRARDKYTCQNPECNKKWEQGMRRFDVHHLDSDSNKTKKYETYEELSRNSITYCHKCHLNLPESKIAMKLKLNKKLSVCV